MPQLSSNLSSCRFVIVDTGDIDTLISNVTDQIRQIRQTLNNEIADAVVAENVSLAERLMLPYSHLDEVIHSLEAHRQGA